MDILKEELIGFKFIFIYSVLLYNDVIIFVLCFLNPSSGFKGGGMLDS